MCNRKPFDKGLYKKYDSKAKKYAEKVLSDAGFNVEVNPNKMGVDLIISDKKDVVFYVETEVKKSIHSDEDFAYDTLRILDRKCKYMQLDLPTLFMLFSEDGLRYLCVWSFVVLECPTIILDNKYVEGEKFFNIPMRKVDKDIKKAMKKLRG